jgi:hypothetical protein
MPRRHKQNETQSEKQLSAQEDLNTAQREKLVLDLRIAGHDFDTIAQLAGYANRSVAWKAYRRALARIPQASAQQERQLDARRLDELLKAYWEKAVSGDGWSYDRILRGLERRASLLGLDVKAGDLAQPAAQTLIREYGATVEDV